jgi:2-keto-3-deoxy-6-phosphogluconate aldolase
VDALETIRTDRVVAVVRGERVADPFGLATTLAGAGIRAIEFTFTIPHVLTAIEAAAGSAAVVGAGDVLSSLWRRARGRGPRTGRAVAALAADPEVMRMSGGVFSSWSLSEEYGFTDIDGRRPNMWAHLAETGQPSKRLPMFGWKVVRT